MTALKGHAMHSPLTLPSDASPGASEFTSPVCRPRPAAETLAGLIQWYETLTPERLDDGADWYAPDAAFKDPFNDVKGWPAIRQVFAHMFRTCDAPRFVVLHQLHQGPRATLSWVFVLALDGQPLEVHGMTELVFDEMGRVARHRDYWDSSEELLQKLPWVGGLFRWVAGRLSAR
jgi:ketosteroid isomerase-like protein